MLEGYALLDQVNRSFDSKEEEAERIASEIVAKYRSDYGLFTLATFSLAKLHVRKKMYHDAIGLIAQIESNRPASIVFDDYLTSELAFYKAQALEEIGDYSTAKESYVHALDCASRSFNLPLARRVMLHLATLERAQGNDGQARILFDKLLATASPCEPDVTASALVQRAEIALSERDLSKVKELLMTAIDLRQKAHNFGHPKSEELLKASKRISELATQG